MFGNFCFGRCGDEDIGPVGFRGPFLRFSCRQQQTADGDVLQGHGNQIFHFERNDLRQLGGIAKGEGEGSDKHILAGECCDNLSTAIQTMLPEKISEHGRSMRRLRVFLPPIEARAGENIPPIHARSGVGETAQP